MRLNQYLAKHTALSRRSADAAIAEGRVMVNNTTADLGQSVDDNDRVTLDGNDIVLQHTKSIMFHKPIKIICSKTQQGNVPTVYSLLPEDLQHLAYVGRLDKDTSGLLIMSNDGELIQQITHPGHEIDKQYVVQLDKVLDDSDLERLKTGVQLDDGLSKFKISGKGRDWTVIIHEGRNRQIRRTFEALGYEVTKLHREKIGKLSLGNLASGEYREISAEDIL